MARRTGFFAIAAVAAVLLVPVAERELRWVPVAVATTYAVLAVLSGLEMLSRRR